jgi:membrane-associated phospholipid phosphatase
MNLKAALIALVSLLVIIGTEFAYRKPLFKETLELAHKLQRN